MALSKEKRQLLAKSFVVLNYNQVTRMTPLLTIRLKTTTPHQWATLSFEKELMCISPSIKLSFNGRSVRTHETSAMSSEL
ncbi:hypothetical protein TNCV_3902751 [Trichonephila clavipes]|nr:hypothetical protein TNCV_3902751 [Trichonephila clavipes]